MIGIIFGLGIQGRSPCLKRCSECKLLEVCVGGYGDVRAFYGLITNTSVAQHFTPYFLGPVYGGRDGGMMHEGLGFRAAGSFKVWMKLKIRTLPVRLAFLLLLKGGTLDSYPSAVGFKASK